MSSPEDAGNTVPSQVATSDATFSDVTLHLDVSQCEPDLVNLFMDLGGRVDAAAAVCDTVFSVTDSDPISVRNLGDQPCKIAIKLPYTEMKIVNEVKFLTIPARTRLRIETKRYCASIGGTPVKSPAGGSSRYLQQILSPRSHSMIGLTYNQWKAHAAAIGVSDAYITANGKTEHPINVYFEKATDEHRQILSDAAQILQTFTQEAYANRQNLFIYPEAPGLTKAVFAHGDTWDSLSLLLAAASANQKLLVLPKTLEALYKAAISTACGHDDQRRFTFLSRTEKPGIEAAKEMPLVSYATSLAVSFLMPYRSDGRTQVTPTGVEFKSAESFAMNYINAEQAGDCDNSALMITNCIHQAIKIAKTGSQKEYPHLVAINNAFCPYFRVGMTIIGAKSAEATNANSANNQTQIQGHAAALVIPVRDMLEGLLHPDDPDGLQKVRFQACFSDELIEHLPPWEKEALRSEGMEFLRQVTSFKASIIEGTAPMDATLWDEDAETRNISAHLFQRDRQAFRQMSPNVGRPVMAIHSANPKNPANPNGMYEALVELHLPLSDPLFTDLGVRAKGHPTSQYILSPLMPGNVVQAGVTPKDVAQGNYKLFPLARLTGEQAAIYEYAAFANISEIMPLSSEFTTLSKLQTDQYKTNMEKLKQVDAELNKGGKTVKDEHVVAFVIPAATLAYSSEGIQLFCERLKQQSVEACVDFMPIQDLIRGADGEDMGMFVTVNAYVPISM